MISVNILLDSVDKVKKFTDIVSKFEADMDLIYGRYTINAKSIMGIFSFDLSQPVELRIYKDREGAEEILGQLKDYLV